MESRSFFARFILSAFWFAAFDEPWKGDPDDPRAAEKHWGLFNVDRTPKEAMR